jgi:putative membrane protein
MFIELMTVMIGAATPVAMGPMLPAARPAADTLITMTDGYILGLRNMVDEEEIETARLAIGKASDDSVRAFARSLLHGHSNAQNSASAFGKRLDITLMIPADSDSAIVHRHRAEVARLMKLNGAQFDRAFLTYVRDDHIATIARVRNWYAPAADNAQVKKYLQDIMPTLQAHQRTAAHLLRMVAKNNGALE